MADDSRVGRIQLGEQFTVTLNGIVQPPPPNRLVGLLLLMLAESSPGWVSRRDLGESLYPGADLGRQAAAARQAISRLRRWLPEADVQTRRGAVRLAGRWELDFLTARGDQAQGLRIAPGTEHPWMDAFRRRQGEGAEVQPVSQERLLFEAISMVAREDHEAARNLLCGAPEIISLLPETELSWLLGVTRPKSRREPKASEHEALVGAVLFGSRQTADGG